ncbi:VOC family virulence protein [Cellulophaga baltica]|uniref:Catechol 2,3-dioxygenase n=1 Tax=Cellulophaga baltica TaxID=76594 RepID=A0A1G7M8Z8_9FLAO|nr:VOC family virulence protein [Cellulophaga baltica]SDF58207.1 Catechol 2,3-dioxygenase [Cellulophaga baltica]
MKDIKLDHCVINLSNWGRSNEFYSKVLGAEIIPIGNGFSYRFGETQLNCHGPNINGTPVARNKVLPGGSDLCFIWEKSIEKLKEHSIEIEVGPVKRFGVKGKGMSFYFRDPEGSLMTDTQIQKT